MADSLFKGADVSEIISHASGMTKAIHFDKVGLEKTICQSIQASVSVQIQTLYEIGSRNAHRVMGRPSGQGSLSNIMGPTQETVTAIAQLCNVCKPDNLIINFTNACGKPGKGLRFKDCVCNSIQAQADAAGDSISGSWGLIFSDVELVP